MGCKICGRNNCTESFHSIEDQEKVGIYEDMSSDQLIHECITKDDEIDYLNSRAQKLAEALEELADVASECDSWQSFPQKDLDAAYDALQD